MAAKVERTRNAPPSAHLVPQKQAGLAWRGTRDPYRIWISEIMLQQTRVAAVIPYYERFLARFPDVAALASAPEQELLAAWAGLGYYSRARNLQRASKKILELGAFPSDYLSLRDLAGVGEYTAAAIASMAFNLPHAVLDGNAIRVLSRLSAEEGNIGSGAVRKRLGELADALLDPQRPGEFNQALMELGAMVCLPKQPQCSLCPLAQQCQARQTGRETQLPIRSGRVKPVGLEKQLVAIEKHGKILLWQRGAESRRLAGFWELPELHQLGGARIEGKVGRFRHTIVNTNYLFEVHRSFIGARPKGFRRLAGFYKAQWRRCTWDKAKESSRWCCSGKPGRAIAPHSADSSSRHDRWDCPFVLGSYDPGL